MRMTLYPFELKFRHPFTISRKSKDVQPLLVVRLEQNGLYGLGETADNSYYGMTVPLLMEAISHHREFIESYQLETPEQFWKDLYPLFENNLFALCALDMAAWDLYGKMKALPLYKLWNLDISRNPLTDYTIGLDTVEHMVSKLLEFPWPVYKIKLGTQEDIKIIAELRRHTSAIFRVDANCAWTADQTLRNAEALRPLGVEFIEQPLKAEDWQGMQHLRSNSTLPLIADESCIREPDVERCAGYFQGINIKLVKCGGITAATRMIFRARQLGMKVMVGSMNESTVGTSAMAHLLPLIDYADMDGPLLLENDRAKGVRINAGKIIYAKGNGTGAELTVE